MNRKVRQIALKRIHMLFELAKQVVHERPDLADRYVEIARKIAMRARIHLQKEQRLLEKNVSSISHHLNVLEKAGLVEKTKTLIKGNLVEKFYRATAKKFVISYTLSEGLIPESEDIAKWSREVCKRAVRNLPAFGYEVTPEDEKELFELVEKYSSLKHLTFEKIISQQKKPVSVTGPPLRMLLSLLESVKLYENEEFRHIINSLSEKLKSLKES